MSNDYNDYRTQIRKTFQSLSDRALAFQDGRIVGGIDRQECDAELLRRATAARQLFSRVSA